MFLEIVGIIAVIKIASSVCKCADEFDDFVEDLDEAQENPDTLHEENMREE